MHPTTVIEGGGPVAPAGAGRPRVVVIGAGFGGLEAVRALAKAPVDVTLVDRRNFHLFQPLLYQVATAALSPGDIAWPIRSIFARQKNVTTLMLDVTAIDTAARTVGNGTTTLGYDYLVLATGATHAYFGHDGWASFAPGLKAIDDALMLRGRILAAFERAEVAETLADRHRELTIVIVGGGATGVEMAGAIAELAHKTLKSEFRRIDPAQTRIFLIEAGGRVLATFPEALSADAARSLASMGVEVRTGVAVTECDASGVTVAGGKQIRAATVVWAAGVHASPAAAWLDVDRDRNGRAKVGPDLSAPSHPGVFVVGDTVTITAPDGSLVPGVAAAAKQMGAYVGRRIAAEVKGRGIPAPFAYRDQGELATIGRKSAIVSMGRLRLTGFIGWLFWCFVHIMFLVGFRIRVAVAFGWFWNFVTYQRGVRLISDRDTGPGTPRATSSQEWRAAAPPSAKSGA